jgi:hypothetical protein
MKPSTMAPTSHRNCAHSGIYKEALSIYKGLTDRYRHKLSIKPLGIVSAAVKDLNEDELYPMCVPLLMLLFFSRGAVLIDCCPLIGLRCAGR